MKKSLSFFLFAVLASSAYSQLTIQSGATFFIQPGATVTVQGDVVTNADIQGTGILLMKGSALQTLYINGFTIPNLKIDNTSNVALGSGAIIGSNLDFTSGKFLLNAANLTIASAATITNSDNTKYIITNSTGRLIKNALGTTAFTYPVGFDATSYNPLTLTQNGTVDNIGVRVNQNVLSGGTAGSPFVKEVVDASWDLSEGVAGGNNLNMTAGWSGTDELIGFNRSKTGVSFYDGVGWDMTNAMTAAATGGGPFTINRNSVTSLGVFAVGTRPVLIKLLAAPKVYLQGAYVNTGTPGLMRDDLRAAGIIPATEPYTALVTGTFTHSGSGGGETRPSSLLSGTGTGADIVDWVFVELRNGVTGTVITSRAVFVQRDGNLVDLDGTDTKVPYINFAGEVAGSYNVAIRHRNHLGVRTPGTISLSRTVPTVYDFTTSASQALGGIQADLGGGRFGMWGGNANANTSSRYTGGGPINDNAYLLNTVLSGIKSTVVTGYSLGDLNMNGTARYTGGAAINDNAFLLNVVLAGIKSAVITQAF